LSVVSDPWPEVADVGSGAGASPADVGVSASLALAAPPEAGAQTECSST
jgi:hypothetical protein